MSNPLYVALVWHMHQPFYQDTEDGRYLLPWVRLHAVKDYLHVAQVIEDYPDVHQTINVVPSLAEQLQDYASGRAVDEAFAISQKTRLTASDKKHLLDNFFSINWDHFVWPVPRYAHLARLREAADGSVDLFSDTFWTDLIVWFNLAWVDPSARRDDQQLRALIEKGRDFDRADVKTVLAYHRETCGKVLPAYRRLADRGQIELSTTPYFHPILPLLIDTRSAREARPQVDLPRIRFSSPDDAAQHVREAMRYHAEIFGREPAGLWPAEGSVSQATLELASAFSNLRWIATDEHVLARALGVSLDRDGYGHLHDPRPLYQPYRISGLSPAVFFRDQTLSDRIGFVYQHMNSVDAANDLVGRLLTMWERLADDEQCHVVSIVLDGENCWEHYPNNGDDFLRALFERLSHEPRLRTVTPAEYLDRVPVRGELPKLPSASWIGGNFDTWIGEPSQNRAWEYLALVRSRLTSWERVHPPARRSAEEAERFERARRAMMIAEGSDWFWWYYSHNRPGGENLFDVAFRRHLANVYRAIDAPVPAWLEHPIDGHAPLRRKGITGLITLPTLGAEFPAAAEWANAGFIDPETSTGAMQHGATFFRRFYYGYDRSNLYLRVETVSNLDLANLSIFVGVDDDRTALIVDGIGDTALDQASSRFAWRIDVPGGEARSASLSQAGDDGQWRYLSRIDEVALGNNVAEIKLDWSSCGIEWERSVRLAAAAFRDGTLIGSLPDHSVVSFRLVDVPEPHPQPGVMEGGRRD